MNYDEQTRTYTIDIPENVSYQEYAQWFEDVFTGKENAEYDFSLDESRNTSIADYVWLPIRFDVYARDEDNTCYNVEMQVLSQTVLPQRTRISE